MNSELEKTFSFLRNFKIKGFTNLRIEKVIVCENNETKNILFVYLKVQSRNWQKYYLDAGAGFWNNTKTKNYSKLIDIDNSKNFTFKDYTKKLDVENKIISKVYCEPNEENCQIIIEVEKGEKVVLRCKDSKLFDSDCEILKE